MKIPKLFDSRTVYAILPIIPILVILYITDSFYTDISNLKTEYISNIENLKIQKNGTINSIINNRIMQSKIQNNKMIIDLQSKLHTAYGEDDKSHYNMQQDIENIHSKTIIDILTTVIVKDYELTKLYDAIDPDNIVFMSNKYGVIEFADNSHVRKATFIRFKNWRDVISTKTNRTLAENAITSILSMKNNIIFWESDYVTEFRPSTRYIECTYNNFQTIIDSKDENEWKYYNVLVPTYMHIHDSSTDLIIIREINMYKMLEPFIHSIKKYDAMVEEYKFDMTKLIFMKITACIGIAIVLLASFFLAICSASEKIKEKR